MIKSMAALLRAKKQMFITQLNLMARNWLSRCTRHLFSILRTEIDTYKGTADTERDTRNLERMVKNGIRCPTALDIKDHVLVMEFIGKAGWPAPRLKDAALSLDKLRKGYREMIIAMRMLYQKAKLVHADLSEYNILYFEGHLYIIDVSQAVEPNHVHANEFLCRDCVHVSVSFTKGTGFSFVSIVY
ncbi:hypothetical protein M0R45_017074 [Rubus argutus]|uniref:non-specific serine/threonine protein kinase n=1 Tax=Rubus argutus TaxID=59490 RepID=A0AAW1XXZ6_RUBAR